jgi:hypothetical protein
MLMKISLHSKQEVENKVAQEQAELKQQIQQIQIME